MPLALARALCHNAVDLHVIFSCDCSHSVLAFIDVHSICYNFAFGNVHVQFPPQHLCNTCTPNADAIHACAAGYQSFLSCLDCLKFHILSSLVCLRCKGNHFILISNDSAAIFFKITKIAANGQHVRHNVEKRRAGKATGRRTEFGNGRCRRCRRGFSPCLFIVDPVLVLFTTRPL